VNASKFHLTTKTTREAPLSLFHTEAMEPQGAKIIRFCTGSPPPLGLLSHDLYDWTVRL